MLHVDPVDADSKPTPLKVQTPRISNKFQRLLDLRINALNDSRLGSLDLLLGSLGLGWVGGVRFGGGGDGSDR